jgi:hypothetical protein
MWEYVKTNFLNIVSNMGFEDKTYGLKNLIILQLQIKLQLNCNYNT